MLNYSVAELRKTIVKASENQKTIAEEKEKR